VELTVLNLAKNGKWIRKISCNRELCLRLRSLGGKNNYEFSNMLNEHINYGGEQQLVDLFAAKG